VAESVVGSKEVAIIVIGFVLGKILEITGVAFPLTPDQIYQAALAAAGVVRIFWTSGKIQSILPK
jgi:hypothetical protein